MISVIFIVNAKGELIIQRHYKDNVNRSSINAFRTSVIAAQATSAPVVHIDKCSFLYIKQGDVYVCAATRQNLNPAMVFQFLYSLVGVLKAYFAGKFDAEELRNNFVVIFELLDEMMDHGYPQLTAINMLSSVIKSANVRDGTDTDAPDPSSSSITTELTGAVDWRQPGKYKYRKNEVFIDAMESVNLLMSNKGAILRADVSGKVQMKTYLTGMPECKFAMNDKISMEHEARKKGKRRHGAGITLDDCTFHRCVNLGHFDHDRTISFIPPDGEFELMKYRITQNVILPFKITPVVTEHGRARVEYEIQIRGDFSPNLTATVVTVKIPTPANTAKCRFDTVSGGKAKHVPGENVIAWKIKRFNGDASYRLLCEAKLVQSMNEKQWVRPPICLEFQLPMFASSGLHIRSLKVFEKSNYETTKWVRYMTKAGQYQIRI